MNDLLYPLTTLSFEFPWAFVLPFIIAVLLSTSAKKRALNFSSQLYLEGLSPGWRATLRTPILGALATFFVVCATVAAARPQRVSTIERPYEARHLMVALDVSPSMAARDFRSSQGVYSRMEGVKRVSAEFIRSRPLDRIGLVVFAGSAYLQAPLTRDQPLLEQLIKTLDVGIAGDGTAIGDGLGLALKHVAEIPARAKAVILITDGVSNAGQISPLKAAKIAKDLGVMVHTIGIGSTDTGQRGVFGLDGPQALEFDEATLKQIASETGGVYQNASSLEGLRDVYARIDALEASAVKEAEQTVSQELFVPWALLALIGLTLYLALSQTIFFRIQSC